MSSGDGFGSPPTDGKEIEVVISGFEYQPAKIDRKGPNGT